MLIKIIVKQSYDLRYKSSTTPNITTIGTLLLFISGWLL